jgi:hypothetical protein
MTPSGLWKKAEIYYLRYKNIVYKETADSPQPAAINLNFSLDNWNWTLEAPKNHKYDSDVDKLFSFRTFPDKSKFIYLN